MSSNRFGVLFDKTHLFIFSTFTETNIGYYINSYRSYLLCIFSTTGIINARFGLYL